MEIYIDNRQSKVEIDEDIYLLLERLLENHCWWKIWI